MLDTLRDIEAVAARGIGRRHRGLVLQSCDDITVCRQQMCGVLPGSIVEDSSFRARLPRRPGQTTRPAQELFRTNQSAPKTCNNCSRTLGAIIGHGPGKEPEGDESWSP